MEQLLGNGRLWHDLLESKGTAVVLGLLSHLLLMQGEVDLKMHIIISVWIAGFSILTGILYCCNDNVSSIAQALSVVRSVAVTYFGTILASMVLYRAFFHRLRQFPGPFLARISKFYSLYLVLPRKQYFLETEKLHHKYGDYVRTGPRELSVIDVEAISAIHGVAAKTSKGVWYGPAAHIEGSSLHTTRDKRDHKERRRAWDRAFSTKALRDYEPRIERHTIRLIEQLSSRIKEPVLLSDWTHFFSFDIISDIGFSRSFGMLENGTEDDLIKRLHASMSLLAVFTHLTWLIHLILLLPKGAQDLRDFIDWSLDVLRERKKITPQENDIVSWLLDPNEQDLPLNLTADTRLAIVAGSDTTSTTLTWLFYELCKDEKQQRKLQDTIDGVAGDRDFLNCEMLANVPLLDGYINEALRLHPAVSGGVQRETPPEGIRIGDTYVPGNINVWMPIHTIHRDARYFSEPLRFIPERWTDRPELVKDKRAFIPFSIGAYNCVGQKLAMMEMRTLTANVLRKFNVSFAPGEDGASLHRDTKDTFTLTIGKLNVMLTPRNS